MIWLNNVSYSIISSLAVRLNHGHHPKHRIMKYDQFFIDNIGKNDSVIDIGCGNGYLTYQIAKKAKFVAAIDLNPKNILVAKKRFTANNIDYKIADATKIQEFDQKFDVIVLSNVLEHLDNRVWFLKKVKTLAPKILIRVPMIDRDWLTIYKKHHKCSYRLDPTHKTEYTIMSFTKETKSAGLEIEDYSIHFGEIWAIISER